MKSHIAQSDHELQTQKLLYILFQHKKHCAMILAWFSIIPSPKLFFCKVHIVKKLIQWGDMCTCTIWWDQVSITFSSWAYHSMLHSCCNHCITLPFPNISFLEKRDCIFSDGSSITEQSSHERQNPFWFYLQFCCTQRGFLQN